MIFFLPEHNIGAFVVYNRKTPFQTGREFRQAFLDHYYPVTAAPPTRRGDPALAREFAGAYRESRWSHSRADKIIYLFTRYYTMEATADGRLRLDGVAYVATEPGVFQAVDGEGRGRYWSTTRRMHYTLIALAGCVFAGWLNYWNLLRLWQF